MAPPASNSSSARPWDLWLSENIEALAIAVGMALILKFFVVEAYQIPTGSMQPTILGDARAGIHDRILADKTVTLLRDPHRWEVMIFRFPLDERRLYVKRIVGLPGETLEILGGDVWIDGEIARKPDHVNESVLRSIHGSEAMDVGRYFSTEGEGVQVVRQSARFGAEGGGLHLRENVTDNFLHGYDSSWGIAPSQAHLGNRLVPDLDVRARVAAQQGAREVSVTFSTGREDVRFVLPVGDADDNRAYAEVLPRDGTDSQRFEAQVVGGLPVGRAVDVLVRSVDRRLLLEVDGEEWLRADDDLSGPRSEQPSRALVSLASDGPAEIDALHLRRDTFYLPHSSRPMPGGARWEIPEAHYFGLGDNTQSSHDSRSWETLTYDLKSGETITGFSFNNPRAPDRNPMIQGDTLLFADIHGDALRFQRSNILRERHAEAPFIPADNLLGKATAVFWPVFNPFRWKLIR
ncbi:MAG: hypothetical protein DHS20C15_09850 [Planctomycetota bacterium]|nr:MAG: hypothetical protein DHS20C15_09850 [Planctomycetota bacterium]